MFLGFTQFKSIKQRFIKNNLNHDLFEILENTLKHKIQQYTTNGNVFN